MFRRNCWVSSSSHSRFSMTRNVNTDSGNTRPNFIPPSIRPYVRLFLILIQCEHCATDIVLVSYLGFARPHPMKFICRTSLQNRYHRSFLLPELKLIIGIEAESIWVFNVICNAKVNLRDSWLLFRGVRFKRKIERRFLLPRTVVLHPKKISKVQLIWAFNSMFLGNGILFPVIIWSKSS